MLHSNKRHYQIWYGALSGLMFLIPSLSYYLSAQGVCGAEIEKRYYLPDEGILNVRIQVCRMGAPVDHVVMDWGDGTQDTIITNGAYVGSDYFINMYFATHDYTPGESRHVELRLDAGAAAPGFKNIAYSTSNRFVLTDTVFFYTEETNPELPGAANLGPWMEIQDPVWYEASDTWFTSLQMGQDVFEPDTLTHEMTVFPVAGFEPAAPETELYVEQGLLRWYYPEEPGRYAVGVKVRELRFTNNPIYPGPWTMVSTITKAFTVIVDSNQVVSTLAPVDIPLEVALAPNPATAITTIQVPNYKGEVQLEVINATSQRIISDNWNTSAQTTRQLDVKTWPAGVYFVRLGYAGRTVVKKLVVE